MMQNNISVEKVWYVTGTSKGLGLVFVKKLLQNGYKVVGTSRDKQHLIDAVGPIGNSFNFLAVQVELTNEESIRASFQEAIERFGRIDVLVNNAGYGICGALEENADEDVRKNFDINVFSVFNILRNITPIMREQGSGQIFNISSKVGLIGLPGISVYCATKFAVNGLTEAYAAEVKPFGINVTLVCPGTFRTEILNSEFYNDYKNKLEHYKPIHNRLEFNDQYLSGNQWGDPEKLADLLIEAYELNLTQKETGNYIVVGSEAYPTVRAKQERFVKDLDKWEPIGSKTDYEGYDHSTFNQNLQNFMLNKNK
ncbi:short-chain dehydrogenase/reductase family protein [Heterostelium album PN500]|uniref:Short-chain dehydrogenase/reductase family protein n=1 Tax=Heterostelium pallidum (strain ATCC 26659 / Pp 5 / PN500) TaxID=670386 RepID=D3BGA3_HETP5|nr:short-chain dehydrogenase/reductase family protein [Heterostelium album PN500]EFA79503.1 short-chain dehydrogenase/reductase family protein [Heterostelium album PN500]|eukprot:XP_020431624.1 short-chain dehydrogenase/reductase family protein [Heterostelium album PN500]